jgi:hypothetical protein
VPITTAAAAEIKAILGAQLCATLVELTDPAWFPLPSDKYSSVIS